MFWKIVLRGSNPSGRVLAVLYARTGEAIDSVRRMLDSHQGMLLQAGLSRERAEALSSELPNDGSIQIYMQRDEVVCVPVLMGYRPGSRGRLRIALQKLSRLPTEEVIRFLARIPIALKLDADRAAAESIKRILEGAGGIVEIRSPQDLIGVSSRKNYSAPSRETTVCKEEKRAEPIPSDACGDSSPVMSNTGYSTGKQNDDVQPGIVNFQQPPSVQLKIPPPAEEEAVDESVFSGPHVIEFTVPFVSIPAVISVEQPVLTPPVHMQKTVLVYLFPVASEDSEKVQSILCESLELSQKKVQKLIKNAPVALAGFSERIDALVTMSELTDHGIPVSLVPGSSSSMDPSPGRSLFGWLNGHGRTP